MAALSAELAAIGSRLGTMAERPDDQEQAQVLGHQLRNVLCACSLLAEVSPEALTARTLSEFSAAV